MNFTKVLQEKYLVQNLWFFNILSHVNYNNCRLPQHEPLCLIRDFTVILFFFFQIYCLDAVSCATAYPPLPDNPGTDLSCFLNCYLLYYKQRSRIRQLQWFCYFCRYKKTLQLSFYMIIKGRFMAVLYF